LGNRLDYILNLRKTLENICEKHENDEQRISSLLNTILCDADIDIEKAQKSGIYNAVILGTENTAKINSILDIDCTGIIGSTLRSVVKIIRSEERSDVVIEFVDKSENFTESNSTRIEKSFVIRGRSINLKRYPNAVPPLIIENSSKFLVDIDEDLRVLDGRGLIKEIKIHLPIISDNSVKSYISNLTIIPESILFEEGADENTDFRSHHILSVLAKYSIFFHSLNMVILNSSEKGVLNSFFSLINAFSEYFSFSEQEKNLILPQIFFASNEVLKKENFKESTLCQNFDLIEEKHEKKTFRKILYFLMRRFLDKKNSLPAVTRDIEKVFDDFGKVFGLMPRDVIVHSDMIKKNLEEIKSSRSSTKKERAVIIDEIKSLFEYIVNFAMEYNNSRIQLSVKKLRDEFKKNSSTYLEKNRSLKNLYIIEDYLVETSDFNTMIDKTLQSMTELSAQMFSSLDFSEITTFVAEIQKHIPKLKYFNKKSDFYDDIIKFTLKEIDNFLN